MTTTTPPRDDQPLATDSPPVQKPPIDDQESPQLANGELKTCPMCAEEVKAAALVCRFCGHSFDQPKKKSASPPPKPPAGPAPDAITKNLRSGEELFVWADCYLYGASGKLAVTTDRIFFVRLDGRAESHALNVGRKVLVATTTVKVEFGDGPWFFRQLHPETAKEIGATIVPGLIERLFEGDPDMRQRLRERHARIVERLSALAPKPATASATVKGCRYLGGISKLRGPRNVTLVFEPSAIIVRERMTTIFTVSKPQRGAVAIQGSEQLQQRLSATRLASLGVFALAAPKRTRTAISYVTLTMANGETGVFEIKDTDPMKLQARLSPWLAEH